MMYRFSFAINCFELSDYIVHGRIVSDDRKQQRPFIVINHQINIL